MNKPNFEACQLVASKNINLQEMRVGRVKSVFTKTEEEKVCGWFGKILIKRELQRD